MLYTPEPEYRLGTEFCQPVVKSTFAPCRPVEENTEFLEDLAKASKGKGVILMCEAGGTTKPSPNFAAGKASRSLKVRPCQFGQPCKRHLHVICWKAELARGVQDMLFGKWYKMQPYIVAGYMHIPFDDTIWRGEHLLACIACLLLAVGMSSTLDCMQQVQNIISTLHSTNKGFVAG